MSGEWREEYAELLEQLVCGEREESDPVVERAKSECREFRERWEELKQVRARLESSSGERVSLLERARETPAVPIEAAALEAFRARMALDRPPARLTLRARLALSAAALVLIGGLYLSVDRRAVSRDDGGRLGPSSGLQLLEPKLRAKEPVHLVWKPAEDPRVFRYEVSVWDAEDSAAEQPIERSTTRGSEYDVGQPLPSRIVIRIQPLDANGRPVGPPLSEPIEVER